MNHPTRREFLLQTTCAVAFATVNPFAVFAQTPCTVAHPLDPPDPAFSGRCPNCGMQRSQWARTWKRFAIENQDYEACSFHCLADLAAKSGQRPSDVETALYQTPAILQAADSAAFVIGSSAPGTMTVKSKAAFANRSQAQAFARACGGRVADYADTFAVAAAELGRENAVIDQKRLKSGKIVTPADGVDECPVCLMFPARYPKHHCQVRDADGTVFHFCSTQCLFAFLENPRRHARRVIDPSMIWVRDYAENRWISGWTAYYVLGSKQWGPMGSEAFAFDRIDAARRFQSQSGGFILGYEDVTLHGIKTR